MLQEKKQEKTTKKTVKKKKSFLRRKSNIDCLQSAFSLKIHLVLISARRLQTPMLRYNKGLGPDEKIIIIVIFSSGAYALVYHGSRLRRSRSWVFSCSNFAKENKRLGSQSTLSIAPRQLIKNRIVELIIRSV